jgi:aldehyde dehydrogenase (NAD+)
MREEIFGPVACIVGYDRLDDAIDHANDTDYGLTASVWSSDVGAALRVATRLQAGSVSINQAAVIAPWAPFGGHKQSGIGVELGLEALRDCVQLKNIMVKLPG